LSRINLFAKLHHIVGKAKQALIIVLGIVILIAVLLSVFNFLVPKGAGVLVETDPPSSVYINNEEVGRTPFSTVRKPGEAVLRIIPDSFGTPLPPYETKTTLVSGVQTVIRRKIAESEDASEGEIISFEKVDRGQIGMAIVSDPESAQISIDGQVRGFSPYNSSNINEGEHSLSVSANGYTTRSIQVKAVSGYKLIALVKLARSNEPTNTTENSTSQQQEEANKQMLEILSTPTGFLRVRSEPSTLASEVGQVKPGETYELVEEDTDTGWFKIIFAEGKEGWITSQYAKVVEASQPTPTPTKKMTPTPTLSA
jgi:hypothetical protein